MSDAICSIVIPAHNEEAVIGDLLNGLVGDAPGKFEIVVICNGCTDDTATVARRFGSAVQVLDITEPSKLIALARGDKTAKSFPRLYVDADVELSAASAERLVDGLSGGDLLAVAPKRIVPRSRVSPWVRWYYDVWEQLPQVRDGLFGRGVFAVTSRGYERIRTMPALMGDDLVASEAFETDERAIVQDAEVVVWPPKTSGDLLRRRVRAVTGNAQADRAGVRRPASSTSFATLVELARHRPALLPKLPVFIGIGLMSRVLAWRAVRSGDTTTWLRDNSSRKRAEDPIAARRDGT